MCKKGNQAIFKDCRDALLGIGNAPSMRTAEMRRLLAARGGCMNGRGEHKGLSPQRDSPTTP